MIQLRCPRCGETVSFSTTDEVATCPNCNSTAQVHGKADKRPQDIDKEKGITSAMWIIALLTAVCFGTPIFFGYLWGGEAAEMCEINATEGAKIYEGSELLGKAPMQVPRDAEPRELRIVSKESEQKLTLPAAKTSLPCPTLN